MNRWIARLWREWIVASRRKIAPAIAKPDPASWSDDRVTVAWIGHATVLINFFGVKIITDPVLFSRIGIRIPPLFTIGPKRLTAPALPVHELSPIDIVLLSHAHFDHIDRRTLRHFDSTVQVVTAPRTRDLLRGTHLRQITELKWRERKTVETAAGKIDIVACQVNHWGARVRRDTYRGYNAYLIERNGPSSPQDESVRMADRTGVYATARQGDEG